MKSHSVCFFNLLLTQEAQLMLTNPHDAFSNQSRSPNMATRRIARKPHL